MVRVYHVGRLGLARRPASHYYFAQGCTPEKKGGPSADSDLRRLPWGETAHFHIFRLPLGISANRTL
ncbi:protein of unknown function [Acidithiobacillus ferrivorans]|uniref:Uncharacterized protein n=1 Tax=Acidithiobacillus ferrivorans TaxID=160808 RepID=A0ABY1MRR8_9PROT|nr:protein of unknown function [Acidithiobacillus ferrivorans]